ncbi:MAG: ferredoxin [Anaerotignum sp.]
MKIEKVWAVFFSPTGGTKKITTTVAKTIAEILDVDFSTYDFTLPQKRMEEFTFNEGELVVMGTPVIAGRVPNLLLPYLNEKISGKGAIGIPVVSFGNRDYDDALIELRNIMEQKGFLTVAGGAFVSEHSFSRTLGAARPDAEDIEKLIAFGEKIAKKMKDGAVYETPIAVRGENPIRPYFTPRDRHENAIDIRKVKPKTSQDCCGCGICVASCPLGSIPKENPMITTGICMKCCACIKKCPTGAKYFDDPGFIYHKEELEALYAKRKETEYFV